MSHIPSATVKLPAGSGRIQGADRKPAAYTPQVAAQQVSKHQVAVPAASKQQVAAPPASKQESRPKRYSSQRQRPAADVGYQDQDVALQQPQQQPQAMTARTPPTATAPRTPPVSSSMKTPTATAQPFYPSAGRKFYSIVLLIIAHPHLTWIFFFFLYFS